MGNKRHTASYSFASVGELNQDYISRQQEISRPSFNLGIKSPLELGDDRFLKMHKSGELVSMISDNLRNLMLTNKGERLGNYQFGANLKPLLFELGTESADAQAMIRIKSNVKKYMPYINLIGFEIENVSEPADFGSSIGKLIKISFDVPALKSNIVHGVEIAIYFGE